MSVDFWAGANAQRALYFRRIGHIWSLGIIYDREIGDHYRVAEVQGREWGNEIPWARGLPGVGVVRGYL